MTEDWIVRLILGVIAIVLGWMVRDLGQENTRLRKANAAFSAFDRDHDGKPGGSVKRG